MDDLKFLKRRRNIYFALIVLLFIVFILVMNMIPHSQLSDDMQLIVILALFVLFILILFFLSNKFDKYNKEANATNMMLKIPTSYTEVQLLPAENEFDKSLRADNGISSVHIKRNPIELYVIDVKYFYSGNDVKPQVIHVSLDEAKKFINFDSLH